MPACDECEFVAKSGKGLAQHRWSKHLDKSAGGNVEALHTTLSELERMGRVEPVDQARVTALCSMAAALDLSPFNSQMWREYREGLERLTADDGDDGGAVEALIERLSAGSRDPQAS